MIGKWNVEETKGFFTVNQEKSRMSTWLYRLVFVGVVFAAAGLAGAAESAALAGQWRFELDRRDAGMAAKWFARDLTGTIRLPGVLQAHGYGDEIGTATPWVLSLYDRNWFRRADYQAFVNPGNVKVPFVCQPPRHYLGAAWYQRDIEIPADWVNRQVTLFLERPRWETQVWLDDRHIGSNNSLCVPHEFDLGQLIPGKHRLTIHADNRMLLPYRPDAHAVSDSLNSTWNGITGAIELRSVPPVHFADLQVFPQLENATAIVRGRLDNTTGQTMTCTLGFCLLDRNDARPRIPANPQPLACPPEGTRFEFVVPCGNPVIPWDEFSPRLYELTAVLNAGTDHSETRQTMIGFRDFRADGQNFLINGHSVHLRGTHHGGDFPLTGYPPADTAYWLKLFGICKQWGLNHVRFHSFCPPEAAFTAADELGLYLQIEPGMWNELNPGTPMEKMLYLETERILKAYGNHPSFVLLSASNEPKGRWKQALPRWVAQCRSLDSRHLYTTGTGWSLIDEPGPVTGADYLAVHRIGGNMLRSHTAWFGRDYGRSLRGVNVPVVSHELGQWCAYPDFDVIRKFTGYMRPGNYEIFRDSAAAHGLLEKNHEFALASGRFQLACYKEEVEANLRTPGLAGFQLLDLHDYVGQGTALVGLLDPFWEEKGYVDADEWRRFCSPTVPLARLGKRVFTTGETLEAPVEIAHFGAKPLEKAQVTWEILDGAARKFASGSWPDQRLPIGRTTMAVPVSYPLAAVAAPQACRLVVRINGTIWNDWPFWVYPDPEKPVAEPPVVTVTRSWTEAETRLAAGGRVLFLPRPADLDWSSPPLDNVPVFWNRLMSPGWGRMLGLWCNARHPALAGFPTGVNCDWQWTDLVRGARAINLDRLPRDLQPIVQAIDDWNRNWKLGLIFEAKAGPGRLLVCSLDLDSHLESRPVARQLRASLLDYAAGDRFQPAAMLSPMQLRGLWFDTLVMRKLAATASAAGSGAETVLDGDPNTCWIAGGGKGDTAKPPHGLTISFPAPVAFSGILLMNRQNDRDHLGDIRGYALQASDDGQAWREIARGELASTWAPQTIVLAQAATARHLRFSALSGFGNDATAALAEFAILYTGPRLPENAGNESRYQRARSTSTDVDEGPAAPGGEKTQKKGP